MFFDYMDINMDELLNVWLSDIILLILILKVIMINLCLSLAVDWFVRLENAIRFKFESEYLAHLVIN